MNTKTLAPESLDLSGLAHEFIGPTWQIGPLGNYLTPEDLGLKTLGWQIAEWCTKYLNGPEGGRWVFTNEQFRLLLWWYAVDETGFFRYRSGVLQRIKGWGKDPFGAVLCIVEFVGPCKFGGWSEDGEPKAVTPKKSWVQVAAVSQTQTINTMELMPTLISQRLIDKYGIKLGAELIRANKGRCRLVAVTSNPRTLEGGRSTFVLMNETHHWIKGNQGDVMYETISNNTAKMSCRYLAITNAYLPGELSVAEAMREKYHKVLAGTEPDLGMLYDSIEADERTPLTAEGLFAALPVLRGDAIWLDPKAIMAVALDSVQTEARRRRMWLNQIVSDKDALYTVTHFNSLAREATLKPGDAIALGFDGARYDDSAALVAIRIKDRVTFLLNVWERPSEWDEKKRGRWEVPAQAVDSAVHGAHRNFKVKAFFADVNLWESFITEWTAVYGTSYVAKATQGGAIAWDMRNSVKESTRAHERFMGALLDGTLLHDGDGTLKRHTMNVRRHDTAFGVYFRKESQDTTRKIDVYAAWMLAHEALHRYLTGGKPEKPETGNNFYFM